MNNGNATMEPQANNESRRYVKVAPPTVHAGIGDALRRAYRMDRDMRSLEPFEDLLARLE